MFENHGRGIGAKGKDNGLLVLLAVKDRRVWVEVGYDLEQFITDGLPVKSAGTSWRRISRAATTDAACWRAPRAHRTDCAGTGRHPQRCAASRAGHAARGFRSSPWIIILDHHHRHSDEQRRRPAVANAPRATTGARGPWSGWNSGVGPFGGGGRIGGGGFGGGFGGFGGGRSGGGGGGAGW